MKPVKLFSAVIAALFAATVAQGDNITGFIDPIELRNDITLPALSIWVDKDMTALDCPSADCCQPVLPSLRTMRL